MLMRTPFHVIAVFLARIVMPRSRSSGFESSAHSCTTSPRRNAPACLRRPSTSVVLPWSTWATMAMFLTSLRCMGTGAYSRNGLSRPVDIDRELLGAIERGDAEHPGGARIMGGCHVGERAACHIGDDRVPVAQGDLGERRRGGVVDDGPFGRLRDHGAERDAVGAQDAQLAHVAVEAHVGPFGVAALGDPGLRILGELEAQLAGRIRERHGAALDRERADGAELAVAQVVALPGELERAGAVAHLELRMGAGGAGRPAAVTAGGGGDEGEGEEDRFHARLRPSAWAPMTRIAQMASRLAERDESWCSAWNAGSSVRPSRNMRSMPGCT